MRPRIMPLCPASWYYACALRDLQTGPKAVWLGGREFVAFQTPSGVIAVLDGRCAHMGADLARGRVVGARLQCPLHHWEFAADGRCERIPASKAVPAFARQMSYPVAVRGGHVFFCNRTAPPFACPFFPGRQPQELLAARPFDFSVNLPWYIVGANGFDLQHFRAAHDRTLVGEPEVYQPAAFAWTIRATFEVTGSGWRDRLTRWVSGSRVTMTVTSWSGTMILVSAEFRRTTSYGMVCVTPIDESHSRLRTIVWVPRSRRALGRALFDPIDAAVRRSFIRAFVRSDQEASDGIRYNPATLIDADAVLADYFQWLSALVGQRLESVEGSNRCGESH